MRKHCSKNEIHCIAKKWTLIIANQNGYHRWRPQEEWKERVILVNNILLER
jgi:hypothetical protein